MRELLGIRKMAKVRARYEKEIKKCMKALIFIVHLLVTEGTVDERQDVVLGHGGKD